MSRYKDRKEAGDYLATLMLEYQNKSDVIILALPRGGVPVAYEIATQLNLPLDVFLVRKLGVPWQEELAMGAIAENDVCFLNEELIQALRISSEEIQRVISAEKNEIERRLLRYRHGKSLSDLKNKTVILVDDGIATGATVKAAIMSLKLLHPAQIILAVPVASGESLIELRPLVDKIVCPSTPEPFYGVGQWYRSFPQTSDEEVISLLEFPEAKIRHRFF